MSTQAISEKMYKVLVMLLDIEMENIRSGQKNLTDNELNQLKEAINEYNKNKV